MAQPVARRWPPFVSMGAALAMVFLVFPNPLRNPQNNPTASAEYAPIPGRQQSAQDANFGETDLASSGGIGAGGQGFGFLPGGPAPIKPVEFKPQQKVCIGEPPRQTVDFMSPPCVPYFEGDNGGATYQGVTADEVKIILYNDLEVKGDMNARWQASDENRTSADPYGQQTYLVRTIKAQVRYFNKHFMTYGRVVRVKAIESSGGLTSSCAQRNGDAVQIALDEEPFAMVHLGDNGQCFLEKAASKDYGVLGLGLNSDVREERYRSAPGLIWSFFPTQQAEAKWAASFICRTLYSDAQGRKGKGVAHFSTDPDVRNKPRRFGMIYPQKGSGDWERGPESEQLALLLQKYTNEECGMTWSADAAPPEGSHLIGRYLDGGTQGGREGPTIMNKFVSNDVTTIICYCVPVQSELTVTKMMNAATALEYFPEWYWDHGSRMFRAVWNERFNDKEGRHVGFGVNHHWRNPSYKDQFHYRAYLEMEPNSVPNTRFNFDIYHLFLNLYQGLQGAGPKLTYETMQQGMFTFNYQNLNNPYVPTGGYGPYGPRATSDYTWIDTAMGWWWDPNGTPPGGTNGQGCIRVMNEGLRYYEGTWPLGDDLLFPAWDRRDSSTTAVFGGTDRYPSPCSQDDVKIEPNSGVA